MSKSINDPVPEGSILDIIDILENSRDTYKKELKESLTNLLDSYRFCIICGNKFSPLMEMIEDYSEEWKCINCFNEENEL